VSDGLRQVEVQQRGTEQEEAGHLGVKSPSLLEDQLPNIGDVGHDGTVVGVVSRLRRRATLPRRGQALAAQEAEEIRFAHVEPLPFERGEDVGQGGPLAAEFAGMLGDRIAFRGRLGTGPGGGGEERVDVGVASKVVDDRSNTTHMKMKPLSDVIGGCGLVEVSAADLVVPLGR